jgi:hypothetical protein
MRHILSQFRQYREDWLGAGRRRSMLHLVGGIEVLIGIVKLAGALLGHAAIVVARRAIRLQLDRRGVIRDRAVVLLELEIGSAPP